MNRKSSGLLAHPCPSCSSLTMSAARRPNKLAIEPARIVRSGFALHWTVCLLAVCLCAALALRWRWSGQPASSPPNWLEVDRSLVAAIRDGDHAHASDLLRRAADVNTRD